MTQFWLMDNLGLTQIILKTAVERCLPFDNARCAGYSGRTACYPSGEFIFPFVLSVSAGFAAKSKHTNCGF